VSPAAIPGKPVDGETLRKSDLHEKADGEPHPMTADCATDDRVQRLESGMSVARSPNFPEFCGFVGRL
jgi:hypothetical protein